MGPVGRTLLPVLAAALFFGCRGAAAGRAQQGPDAADVLARMHMLDQMVISAAELAPDRSGRDEVLAYAERLQRDHTFADHQVASVARRLGIHLEAAVSRMKQAMTHVQNGPASPAGARKGRSRSPGRQLEAMARLEARVEHLKQVRGSAFDDAFVQTMLAAHEMAVRSLSAAEPGVEAAPLRRLLSRMIPILEQHVALARSLQEQLRS